jgi:hypothetical protein
MSHEPDLRVNRTSKELLRYNILKASQLEFYYFLRYDKQALKAI